MTLILTGETFANGEVEVLCSSCQKVVAIMPFPEVADLSRNLKEDVFCFECDILADVAPHHLIPTRSVSIILYDLDKVPITLLCVNSKGEDVAVRLSSSTNLHKSSQKCTGTGR